MRYSFLTIFFVLIIALGSSCKKNDNVEMPTCESGPGGNVELSFYVTHHDTLIPGALVYVKYNATEFPGTNPASYDLILQTGTSGHATGHAHANGMKCGRYYIYSEGYDPYINDSVFGGIPINVTQREGTFNVSVPVTE